MRYAVISDIHSNLEALTSFLVEKDRLAIDTVVCLGDIVGYNANPNECIDLVRKHGFVCLMGNHDSRGAGLAEPNDFNYNASVAIRWTRKVLTPENADFLGSLPPFISIDNRFIAFHGWLSDTDRYIMSASDAETNLSLMAETGGERIGFFGHTHIPAVYFKKDGRVERLSPEDDVRLEKDSSYLINPGSIGQPRDRDPRASFVVFDVKKKLVTFHRVGYDIQATADKISEAGLPERLGERLKLGW